jgi:hypothetical protein
MGTADIVLACASCGIRYLVPGGVYISGGIDLIRAAMKEGWIPDGHGGHVDPKCAARLGLAAGMAAAVSSAMTSAAAKRDRDRKMGRKPARVDARTLKMSRYLTPAVLADPPPRVDWSSKVSAFGEMGNDAIGDCTCAAAGHLIQTWSAENGAEIIVPDADIIAAYSAVTGYKPDDPSTDNGAVELDVLNYWRQTGIGGHKIAAFVAVDPKNRRQMTIALDLFGGLYAGIEMPVSCQDQEVWAVPAGGPLGAGLPGSWGGHAAPFVNYGPLGVVCVTWGALKTVTWDFVDTYVSELYAVVSVDWADGTRPAPSGVDMAALLSDLALVSG